MKPLPTIKNEGELSESEIANVSGGLNPQPLPPSPPPPPHEINRLP